MENTHNFFVWNASPILLELGFIQIRWYSLMFVIGFTAGFYIGRSFLRREKLDETDLGTFVNYTVFGTIIGARLGHCLFYQPDYYFAHPLEILMIWQGGLASHGGFLGVIIAIYLYLRRKKDWTFLWLCDRAAIPTILVASLIRIGNFFNSEIIGAPSQVPWAVIFEAVDNIPRHPSQIYESLSYFSIFCMMQFLYWRTDIRNQPGRLFGFAIGVGFLARFLLEFCKEDQVPFESLLPINMGQILSIPFIIFGFWLMFRKNPKEFFVKKEIAAASAT